MPFPAFEGTRNRMAAAGLTIDPYGYFTEGRETLDRLLAAAGSEVDAAMRADALGWAALLAAYQGDYEAAREVMESTWLGVGEMPEAVRVAAPVGKEDAPDVVPAGPGYVDAQHFVGEQAIGADLPFVAGDIVIEGVVILANLTVDDAGGIDLFSGLVICSCRWHNRFGQS